MLKLDREAQWFVEGRKPADEQAWNTSLGLDAFGEKGPKTLWNYLPRPKVLIILGSGLGGLVDKFDLAVQKFAFSHIWPWADRELVGHAKQVVIGTLRGIPVMGLAGRLHIYEGYTAEQVVQPILLAKALGVTHVLLTNAAGGINKGWQVGDLMLLTDHLNLMGVNPLIGVNNDELGPRFPGQTHLYQEGIRLLGNAAKAAGITGIRRGVYAALPGPNYETPAEIHYLRRIGADVVGMSTVPEAIVANWCGLKVAGVSLVTNMGAGITGRELSHEEVVEAGERAKYRFEALVMAFLDQILQEQPTSTW